MRSSPTRRPYALAGLLPEPDRTHGGRPSHYPPYMVIVYEALISVYGSARQVEAELAHPLVWQHIRDAVSRHFTDDQKMRVAGGADATTSLPLRAGNASKHPGAPRRD